MEAADWLAIGIMEYQTLIEKYSLVSWKQHLAAHRVHRLNGRDQKLFGEMIFQISLSRYFETEKPWDIKRHETPYL